VPPTTFLFVPAHEDRKVRNALASAADAIILDLEDGVPEGLKAVAREAVARTLLAERALGGPSCWVRLNAADTPHFTADLEAVVWSRVDGAVLPKADDEAVAAAVFGAGAPRVLLLVETAAGLGRLRALARAAGPSPRIALGTVDLARDLGLPDDPDDSEVVWHIRRQLVIESRQLGLDPPVDGVFGRIGDLPGLEAICDRIRSLGFGGKLLVHPQQIAVAARALGVDETRLQAARDIVTAYEAAERGGRGALRHEGELVDRAHVERARALIARWERQQAERAARVGRQP
jgi:citrate lyase beta subunit